MQGIPKSMRVVRRVCVALFLAAGIQAASAFALLGPFAPWMVKPLTYQLPNAIGGPMKMGEGYRWNVPVITYGYDQSFLDYFGSNGVAAVDGAVQILNALPPSSEIVLSNYPFGTLRANPSAQVGNLSDLKSAALIQLVEQMGLAQPRMAAFSLRSFLYDPSNSYAAINVETRNYDPVSLAPSTNVNGVSFGYTVWFYLPPTSFAYPNGGSNGFVPYEGEYIFPPGYAGAVPFPIDPTEIEAPAAADLEFGEQSVGPALFTGRFLLGLTYDDVGGLSYLLSTNTIALESLLPGVRGSGTNASNFVNRALRPGVDKITFQRMDYISTNQQVFPTITNQYVDSYISNGVVQQQTLERVITQPDMLFTANYIGLNSVSRTGTSNWVNNGAPLNGGPGVIQPPIVINFNRFGPSLYFGSSTYPSQDAEPVFPFWGSFDSTTNAPIVYPINPATTNSTEFHLFLGIMGSGLLPTNSFVWNISGATNSLFSLQTSTDLSNWITIGTITNLGGTFTYEDFVFTNTPQRFFRTVPR
jgi:hypothetical protein